MKITRFICDKTGCKNTSKSSKFPTTWKNIKGKHVCNACISKPKKKKKVEKKKTTRTPEICGSTRSRYWPDSWRNYPKQDSMD